MPSKKTIVREWECHACNFTCQVSDLDSGVLPVGWTNAVMTLNAPTPTKMLLDLCPKCSKDPAAAMKRFLATRT